jgi:hypothetical protein
MNNQKETINYTSSIAFLAFFVLPNQSVTVSLIVVFIYEMYGAIASHALIAALIRRQLIPKKGKTNWSTILSIKESFSWHTELQTMS